jgi:hypothetical protein
VAGLGEVFDDLNEVVRPVALFARELEEISTLVDDGTPLRLAGHGNAATATELEQAFITQLA